MIADSLSPAATRTPIIRIEGVSKRFPIRRGWVDTILHPRRTEAQTALDDITLEIREGEIFGLLGQNGAGKTTLFKILATLVLPDEGNVEVAGYDIVRAGARVRELLTPVIPNERSLYWRISARENLRLYAALHGVPRRETHDRIEGLLALVGLAEAEEKQVGLFSSGMKQRLLVARALLSSPRVLLLDEPTRSLDPVSARDFRAFIRHEIAGRQGCTVLLATHDPQEVADLCTRIGILERGRLRAVGAADALVQELQVHRFQLWTRSPHHPSLDELQGRWGAERIERQPALADDWTRVAFDLVDGPDRAAELLHWLTGSGVTISRFEKVELPLAELIERVAADRSAGESTSVSRDRMSPP